MQSRKAGKNAEKYRRRVSIEGASFRSFSPSSSPLLFGALGAKKWNFQADSPVTTTPTIGVDRTVYIGLADGSVYAIKSFGGRFRSCAHCHRAKLPASAFTDRGRALSLWGRRFSVV
jgi:hypothetical protein